MDYGPLTIKHCSAESQMCCKQTHRQCSRGFEKLGVKSRSDLMTCESETYSREVYIIIEMSNGKALLLSCLPFLQGVLWFINRSQSSSHHTSTFLHHPPFFFYDHLSLFSCIVLPLPLVSNVRQSSVCICVSINRSRVCDHTLISP